MDPRPGDQTQEPQQADDLAGRACVAVVGPQFGHPLGALGLEGWAASNGGVEPSNDDSESQGQTAAVDGDRPAEDFA